MESLVELKPSDRVLFLAEGNFTFSWSLVEFWRQKYEFRLLKIAATCFEAEPVSPAAADNVQRLADLGVEVLFAADATKWFVQ
jgi:hypothetical protein